MMDFRQMDLFVAVAEELHFGRAATRSGMSQPPFSQQIRRLERALGAPLLHRTSRRVTLTPAGAVLLAEARELIARRHRVVDTVRRTASGDAGILRIGFSASSAIGVLPIIVRQLRQQLPDVALQIDDRDGIDVSAAISSGALDAAIVRGPFPSSGMVVETLHRDGFVAILPASHPLAERRELEIGDLAGRDFILFPRTASPGLHDTIFGLCSDGGFSPTIVQEAGAWLSVVGLVEGELGITIAPAMAARTCPRGVVAIPIIRTRRCTELVVVYRTGGLDPLVGRFCEIARSSMEE